MLSWSFITLLYYTGGLQSSAATPGFRALIACLNVFWGQRCVVFAENDTDLAIGEYAIAFFFRMRLLDDIIIDIDALMGSWPPNSIDRYFCVNFPYVFNINTDIK